MTLSHNTPAWNAAFEEKLFLAVARRHVPDFPDKLAATPREPATDNEVDAVCDYYTRMASHDLFIVQVVARAIDTLFKDDPHVQLILSRQLGDDGAHAALACERIIAADEETQRRLDDYLHTEYQHTARVFGADITAYRAIYDDWRREILARLVGRDPDALGPLVPLSKAPVAQLA
jgi:hypothetical protein